MSACGLSKGVLREEICGVVDEDVRMSNFLWVVPAIGAVVARMV